MWHVFLTNRKPQALLTPWLTYCPDAWEQLASAPTVQCGINSGDKPAPISTP